MKVLAALERLGNLWVTLKVKSYDGGQRTQALQGRMIILEHRTVQRNLLGEAEDVAAVEFRWGDEFGRVLLGQGQPPFKYISCSLLQYHRRQLKVEKRLLRWLSWVWRCSARSADLTKQVLVSTIHERVCLPRWDEGKGSARDRLEQALDRLLDDGQIAAWQYEAGYREDQVSIREWPSKRILIEPPDAIKDAYASLAAVPTFSAAPSRPTKAKRIGGEVRDARQWQGLSQTALAEVLGLSQPTLSKLEAGRGSARVVRLASGWLDSLKAS